MTLTEHRPTGSSPRAPLDPAALRAVLKEYVRAHRADLPLATQSLSVRSYDMLELDDHLEVWAIHWPTGQGLELHDHGGSAGALLVVQGSLTEHAPAAGADWCGAR